MTERTDAEAFNKHMAEQAKRAFGTGSTDHDPVNHPKHYEYAGFQVIDIIQAVLPAEWFKGFLLGNVIKYILRAFRKNGIEDFKKASWYLTRLIKEQEAD